jgi:uncharacterized protein YndB with AHSA1/START domain
MGVARPVVRTGPGSLRVSVDLIPTPPRAWLLLTEAAHIAVWWSADVKLVPAVDGRLRDLHRAGDSFALTVGRVTRCEAPSILQMTWAEDTWPGATRLAFHLGARSSGTSLVLMHDGWDALPAVARMSLIESYAQSWSEKLGLLAAYAADAA